MPTTYFQTQLAAADMRAARTPGGGTVFYVSTKGSDSNPGSAALPFLTIQHAANLVNPGDTVIVENGTYSNAAASGPSSSLINVARGGTTANYVTFQSQNRWGAVLDGLNITAEGWGIGANYVRIQGFEVKRFRDDAISNYRGGEFADIVQNHIHDIGRYCTDTQIGRDGIYLSSSGAKIEQNSIHDIGRFSPGESGCTVTTRNYQNHDQCIYVNTGADNTTIQNNVIYNCKHGWGVQIQGTVANTLILNNTFAFPNPTKHGQILVAAPVAGLEIENNIFYQPMQVGIRFQDYAYPNGVVRNNITDQSAVYELDAADGNIISSRPPSGLSLTNNTAHTDPLFVGPSVADFSLKSGSPAIDAGLTLPGVINDCVGVARPQGARYDIGAYELPR